MRDRIAKTSMRQKTMDEVRILLFTAVYFGAWVGVFMLLKTLILAEYRIGFSRFSMVLIATLVLAKVVLILEKVSLGGWIRTRPAWVNVLVRTALYSAGVFVVLLLERSFEGRHEHGGFVPAMVAMFRQADHYHVMANAICVAAALLCYNALSVIREYLGKGGLGRVFLSPLPSESKQDQDPAARQYHEPSKTPEL